MVAYINYVSEAPVTLPHISCLAVASEAPKICYGDLHRAAAPKPKEFVPDEFTLADRERRRRWSMAAKARQPPRMEGSIKTFQWTPESVARMIELIRDYGLSRRATADKLNAEFPQSCPVNKSAVVVKFIRETKDPNYGRVRRD